MSIQIIQTADGSHSLLNTDLNETYHSHHGAVQESMHVFIEHGLKFFLSNNYPETVRIFEVGFGTGLNAFLTVQHFNHKIHYTSIEAFPLDESIWSNLNYASNPTDRALFGKLHEADWETNQLITSNFQLLKLKTTLQNIDLSSKTFDLIYFDAFAPNKQPEMWELPLLEKVANSMAKNGVF